MSDQHKEHNRLPPVMQPGDFDFDLRRSLLAAHQIGVSSGSTVVGFVDGTVCGIGPWFSPPWALPNFSALVDWIINDVTIVDEGSLAKKDAGLLYASGTWSVGAITRRGTVHQWIEGRLVSLAVESSLTPAAGEHAVDLEVRFFNRGERPVAVAPKPRVSPGGPAYVSLESWSFGVPAPGAVAEKDNDETWRSPIALLELSVDRQSRSIAPGEATSFLLRFSVTSVADSTGDAAQTRVDVSPRSPRALAFYPPRMETDVPGLKEYYRGAWASALVCFWNRDDFTTSPFVTTCGLDGGGICSYFWDVLGYSSEALALVAPKVLRCHIELSGQVDIRSHYAVAPGGAGVGRHYAYSALAIVRAVWSLACVEGPDAELLGTARAALAAMEEIAAARGGADEFAPLLDFGSHASLLEMRTVGYEHVVASPNAERAWSMERIADLSELVEGNSGAAEADRLRRRAADIYQAVRERLWDAEAGWFRCLHPDGHREIVYSVQVFDALRAGACTHEMVEAVLSRLRDGAFLGEYGVSSVSAEDGLHYEVNDPDWSGGGAYTGDGPQLVQTLYEAGRPKLAWDVLRRLLWMGRHMPYYPQEVYCDRPAAPGHKRANIISGCCGAAAVIYGMLGIRPLPDGSILFAPRAPHGARLRLTGLHMHGIDIDIETTSENVTIVANNHEYHIPTDGELVVHTKELRL